MQQSSIARQLNELAVASTMCCLRLPMAARFIGLVAKHTPAAHTVQPHTQKNAWGFGAMAVDSVRVLLFAKPREIVGSSTVSLTVPAACTVRQLKELLGRAYPALLALLPTCMIAVNELYAEDDAVIAATDEVALIAPVSGG